ncbi:MAG: 2-phospho-L-lactate transferase [Candidatus Hodarchaeota archaeon]
MSSLKVLFLSGGTGTPKLIRGIDNLLDSRNITVIGNTGDDWEFYGLYVSPDLDSILLTFSNLLDTEKWWGIKNDTFNLVHFLRTHMKEEVWFNLGDLDAGLCLFRSSLLKEGLSLTNATDLIRKRMNIRSSILPMADQPIRTMIRTPQCTMHLQEFWVKYKGELDVLNVFFDGNISITTPQVLDAIKKAEIIVIGPSNPISSIGPILAISPLREALQKASGFRVAISPIIGTKAVSGPTSTFLKSWGRAVTPVSVVELYNDFLDGFILHTTDNRYCEEIKSMEVTPLLDDIYIHTEADAARLIKRILEIK